jgi:putative multiple sugar transport system permease protein
MAVLNNGLQLLGIGADMTQIIKGLVLLVAVAFDVYNKTQGKPSITGPAHPQLRQHVQAGPARARSGAPTASRRFPPRKSSPSPDGHPCRMAPTSFTVRKIC